MGQLLTLMVLGDMVAASAGKQGQRQQPGRSAAGNSSSRAQLKTATKKMTQIVTQMKEDLELSIPGLRIRDL